uniref:Uncharacterized protein n=1 Tax=Romanomermis culicivorax TaxID=13658 RepID=A0A915KNE7_ROMCU
MLVECHLYLSSTQSMNENSASSKFRHKRAMLANILWAKRAPEIFNDRNASDRLGLANNARKVDSEA